MSRTPEHKDAGLEPLGAEPEPRSFEPSEAEEPAREPAAADRHDVGGPKKKRPDWLRYFNNYTVFLGLALLALLICIVILLVELNCYKFNIKAKGVVYVAPPAAAAEIFVRPAA